MVLQIDTFGVQQSDKRAFWSDVLSTHFLDARFDPLDDAVLDVSLACAQFGAAGFRRIRSGRNLYVRNERNVRRGDPDALVLTVPSRGSVLISQHGREARVRAGEVMFWDSSHPVLHRPDGFFECDNFVVHRPKLGRFDTDLTKLTVAPIKTDTGVAAVTTHFLRGLAQRAIEVEGDPAAELVGEAVTEMMAALARSVFDLPWVGGDPDSVLFESARQFIVAEHANADLGPTEVAAAVRVSVRKLHGLFAKHDQTVMHLVRRVRILAVRRDLADPALRHLTIGRIAASHGLPNAMVFARAFKAEYGVTARDFRASASASSGLGQPRIDLAR